MSDKHNTARAVFFDWVAIGKPKSGHEFALMQKTRASFNLAVRYCNDNLEQLVLMHYWIKTVINFGILCIKSAK